MPVSAQRVRLRPRAWCSTYGLAAAGAILLGSITFVSGQSAQDLADVRADVNARRYDTALKRLDGLAPTEAVLTLRIEAALGLGDSKVALAAYEELVKPPAKERPELAARIAKTVMTDLSASEDPTIQLEACDVLSRSTRDACRTVMDAHRRDPATPFGTRLGALATLASAGDATAGEEFKRLAAGAQGMSTRSVPNLAVRLPKPLAVSVLTRFLADPDRSMQFAAVSSLGDCGADARPTLEAYIRRVNPPPLARGAAEFALIRTGDREALSKYPGPLDALRDEDAFVVGKALGKAGDPRGAALIVRAASSDNELLQIRAAASLGAADSLLTSRILDNALASRNIWIRAAALHEFCGSPSLSFAVARRLMSDPEPWVKLRAAAAVLAAMPAAGATPRSTTNPAGSKVKK
jgi:hypothetical protein